MTDDYTTVGAHVSLLRRHWLLLGLFLIAGVIAGVLLTPLEKPTYVATSQVLVPNLSGTPLSDQSLSDQVEVVKSDVTVDAVISKLGLDSTRSHVLGQISVTNASDTRVLDITASSSDRDEAAQIANAFANAYLTSVTSQIDSVQSKLQSYYSSQLDAINTQLLALRGQLPTQTTDQKITTRVTLARLTDRRTKVNTALGLVEQPQAPPQNGRVLTEAVTPDANSQSWLRGVLLGLALGLVLGFAAVYTYDRRDDSVRDESGLVDMLGGARVLGRIPNDRASRQSGPVVARGGQGPLPEAYRALSTNLRFLAGGRSARPEGAGNNVVVVTSAVESEGKTSVATNLAVTAAAMGQRVVLIDADLRHPQVAGLFDLQGQTGLAEVIRDAESGSHLLRDVGIPNLRVLPAGARVEDSAEVLSSTRTELLLNELRGEADLIVIDTAPLLPVADTLLLAASADHVVLVVRRGQTKTKQVRAAFARLAVVGATFSGVVLVGLRDDQLASVYQAAPSPAGSSPASAAGA